MREAMLYQKIDDGRVHCFLCAHQCKINNGLFGLCRVRKNIEGTLFTFAYGKLIADSVDPIEKKPLFHFLPGTNSYSIATTGCNFKCGFCQNWQISQISEAEDSGRLHIEMLPETIVQNAVKNGCQSISFTYTEPTIFFEYAFDIARIAKSYQIATVFVTNGFMTDEALQTISPYLDACNVDLKAFSEQFYRKNCAARLQPVLQSIKNMHKAGIWLEITTLLIPGENDSAEEMKDIANFIADLDINIPWHVSRFFPQYEFRDHQATPISKIRLAEEIGHKSGLRFVYGGNVSGRADTVCFNCNELLIEREGYKIGKNKIVNKNRCPKCGKVIEGRWF